MEYIRRTAANPEPDRRKIDRRAVAHYQDQARIARLEEALRGCAEFIYDKYQALGYVKPPSVLRAAYALLVTEEKS